MTRRIVAVRARRGQGSLYRHRAKWLAQVVDPLRAGSLAQRRVRASFPVDPLHPTIPPAAATAWLNAQQRRIAEGLPVLTPADAAGEPVRATPKSGTMGERCESVAAGAQARLAAARSAGVASRGELSRARGQLGAVAWLRKHAHVPTVRRFLAGRPSSMTPADVLAVCNLRAATGRNGAATYSSVRSFYSHLLDMSGHQLPTLPNLRRQLALPNGAQLTPKRAAGLLYRDELQHLRVQAARLTVEAAAKAAQWHAANPTNTQGGIDADTDAVAAAATLLLLATGIRRGELLGLRWRDVIEREPAYLMIRGQESRSRGVIIRTETKTKASERRAPLNGDALAALAVMRTYGADPAADPDAPVYAIRERRRARTTHAVDTLAPLIDAQAVRDRMRSAKQSEHAARRALARERAATGYRRLSDHPLRSAVARLYDATGVNDRGLTVHSLRMAWATWHAWAGSPMAQVQAYGGWESPTILLTVYTRVSGMDPAGIAAMNRV